MGSLAPASQHFGMCRQPAVSSPSSCRQSCRPHLLVSRSSPDGPASSHPRLQINSAALRREHGDLSPVPESPPPAELPCVGFDGSSRRVISNSPGARRPYWPSHRLLGCRSQSQRRDGRWDAGGDGMGVHALPCTQNQPHRCFWGVNPPAGDRTRGPGLLL